VLYLVAQIKEVETHNADMHRELHDKLLAQRSHTKRAVTAVSHEVKLTASHSVSNPLNGGMNGMKSGSVLTAGLGGSGGSICGSSFGERGVGIGDNTKVGVQTKGIGTEPADPTAAVIAEELQLLQHSISSELNRVSSKINNRLKGLSLDMEQMSVTIGRLRRKKDTSQAPTTIQVNIGRN
jgi:hypothetical protein